MGNEFTRAQAYKHKITGKVIKMERVNSNRVVAHFETGPERTSDKDLREEYSCIGTWSDYERDFLNDHSK